MAAEKHTPELIIDGYNVIFRAAPEVMSRPEEIRACRRRLEAAVESLGRHDSVCPWIVYDGRRAGGPAGHVRRSHLRVSYVEPPAEADDAIVQKAGEFARDGRRVTVVTDDRGLARRLEAPGSSRVEAVAVFLSRLHAHSDSGQAENPVTDPDIAHFFMGIDRHLRAGESGELPLPPADELPPGGGGPIAARQARQARGARRQARRLLRQRAAAGAGGRRKGRRRH